MLDLEEEHQSRINAEKMRAMELKAGVTLTDKLQNNVIRLRCSVEDVVINIEKGMLMWFGHVKRTKEY